MPKAENASRETVLYSFRGYPNDGAYPSAGLTSFKGTLYGTTPNGGVQHATEGSCRHISLGCGTVFSITPSGTETVLHSFTGGLDGASPFARLIVRNGTFYGTTYLRGGCHNRSQEGCGTVFSITPSGHETVLHGFADSPDGSNPRAPVRYVNGTLYGATDLGGAYDSGTVYSITLGGKDKVLHSFGNGTDGAAPQSDLIDVNGTFYGTTAGGGAYNNDGTIFSITPGGAEKVLHNFAGAPSDGSTPRAGLTNVNGTLYGTTCDGGANGYGTVYKITTSGTESVLYSFPGAPNDGSCPSAGLINVGGTLYGTTVGGGNGYGSSGAGTVYKITTSGTESVLYSFAGPPSDGEYPLAGLTNVGGTLYGTTAGGGGTGNGIVFSIVP
jgi:uncharacterized repeat protein (TIGR03803 family)